MICFGWVSSVCCCVRSWCLPFFALVGWLVGWLVGRLVEVGRLVGW